MLSIWTKKLSSLIPLSQTQDQVQVSLRVRRVLFHTLEHGLRSTDENPEIDDIVEIYLRPTKRGRRGRPVTKCERVTEIKTNEP